MNNGFYQKMSIEIKHLQSHSDHLMFILEEVFASLVRVYTYCTLG